MKKYFAFYFLFLSFHLSAQTFVGPTLGYDFANLTTNRILKEGTIVNGNQRGRLLIERSAKDDPAGRNSIMFGFQIQKILSPKWSIGLRGSYAQKEYIELIQQYEYTTFVSPEYKLFYQQIGISVLFSRRIKNKISVGIGPNVSHFSKWNSVSNRRYSPVPEFIPYQVTKRAYGLDFQLGYYLGPVYLAADYTRSLKMSDDSGYMTGASSLAISGTYFFELKKRK